MRSIILTMLELKDVFSLQKDDSIFSEYNEMVLQFGFVTLFVTGESIPFAIFAPSEVG